VLADGVEHAASKMGTGISSAAVGGSVHTEATAHAGGSAPEDGGTPRIAPPVAAASSSTASAEPQAPPGLLQPNKDEYHNMWHRLDISPDLYWGWFADKDLNHLNHTWGQDAQSQNYLDQVREHFAWINPIGGKGAFGCKGKAYRAVPHSPVTLADGEDGTNLGAAQNSGTLVERGNWQGTNKKVQSQLAEGTEAAPRPQGADDPEMDGAELAPTMRDARAWVAHVVPNTTGGDTWRCRPACDPKRSGIG